MSGNVLPMPLLDRALEELPADQLILATRLARNTLKDHLDECRVQINELEAKNRRLQDDLNEVSEERNKAKKELRSLKDKIESYVVQLFSVRGPNGTPRALIVTLMEIVENPGDLISHEHCTIAGHDKFCKGCE